MRKPQVASNTSLEPVEEVLPKNLYRRKNGRIYGRVEVEGMDLRKSLGTSNLVVAEERLRRWLAEISPRHGSGEFTFAQVASSWIEQYQSSFTPKTWRRYVTSMKMLKPYFGELYWFEVTRTKINEFITERRKCGVKVATINRDLAVLSNIVHHAIDQDWSEQNPMLAVGRKQRREKRDPFTLPTDEMIEWPWRHMRSAFGDLCRFALETGMRLDEIAQLDKNLNVDLERAAVTTFKTKTHRVRVVTLSETALAIVRRQPGASGWLFRTRQGGRYLAISSMWRETMKRAGKSWSDQYPAQQFIRFRFHDLRHIFAIRYLGNGGNLYVLQKLLGHSTIRQTEEYLRYLSPEEQDRAKWSAQ